jgi:hypothetical protein
MPGRGRGGHRADAGGRDAIYAEPGNAYGMTDYQVS